MNIHKSYVLLCTGVAHKLHHPTVSFSFLNDTGDIINAPSLPYTCEPSVSTPEPSNITDVLGIYYKYLDYSRDEFPVYFAVFKYLDAFHVHLNTFMFTYVDGFKFIFLKYM